MKQRYDLLAFSLLIFSVVLVILISTLSKSLEGIRLEQSLIGSVLGGAITFVGVIVAAWNVTRQMRLTARGREQDKLERELPGLRAAAFLLGRISTAIGRAPTAEKVLKELKARGFDQSKFGDFAQNVIDSLPTTVDFTRREIANELFKLKAFAARIVHTEFELSQATAHHERLLNLIPDKPDGLAEAADRVDEERGALAENIRQLARAVEEFEAFRERLVQRGTAEAAKYEILRREHERSLRLPG